MLSRAERTQLLQDTGPQESYFQLLWEHRAEGPTQLLNICLVAAEGKHTHNSWKARKPLTTHADITEITVWLRVLSFLHLNFKCAFAHFINPQNVQHLKMEIS